MKYKFFLIISVLFFAGNIWSDTVITKHKINWKDVETTVSSLGNREIISFDDAYYPSSDLIPYFNHRMVADPHGSYEVEISNPVYAPVNLKEKSLLSAIQIESQTNIKTYVSHYDNSYFLDIVILPFHLQDNIVLKLVSFDLKIKKTVNPIRKNAQATIHSYSDKSVLATGKFVKIEIEDTGVHKLTNSELVSMGIDPETVRIFGYGGAVLDQDFKNSKIDDLPEIAIWKENDYILFYAQGPIKWNYDRINKIFSHANNPYSKYGYYFVTSEVGVGKKIEDAGLVMPDEQSTIHVVTQFTDYLLHEKETRSLIQSGKEFYGEEFKDVLTYNFTFDFPNAILNENAVRVKLDVVASALSESSFSLRLGNKVSSLNVSPTTTQQEDFARTSADFFNFTPNQDNLTFNLKYNKSTGVAVGYLNFIEVNCRRNLIMTGSAMPFRSLDNLDGKSFNKYELISENPNLKVWDITDQQNIKEINIDKSGDRISFISKNININGGGQIKEYLAIDTKSSNFLSPRVVGVVTNQNLHAFASVDLLIITHPDFLAEANRLADAHRRIDNMSVEVVTAEEVYNEFSSGTPDVTAYRWLMKMIYDRDLQTNPTSKKYLLLFGRGSFDNRSILTNSSGHNFILTYQADNSVHKTNSYVTDDYFGFMDDNEGVKIDSDKLDIGVGRFPVINKQQAKDLVNKTISYMQNTKKGAWKNQLCFIADDGNGVLHVKQSDEIASKFVRTDPDYQVNKVYLDAYKQEITASGESYPLVKNRIKNLINSGLFFLNYTGHAGTDGWANEKILTSKDISNLSNQHLPLCFAATCDFLRFDSGTQSAGENFVLNPVGGCIGLVAAARTVFADPNHTLNKYFCDSLLVKRSGQHLRVGDIHALAKNRVSPQINKLSFVYLGDPALKLGYPTQFKVKTTQINNNTQLVNDTLKALSTTLIHGIIVDDSNVKVENFNGLVTISIYDKVQTIKTLNNDKADPHESGVFTYTDRPNLLFSGKVEVKDGAFQISFLLPKDIKYNYGTGRINYYAQDDKNNYEAQGYFENFLVGGSNEDFEEDTEGPIISSVYLNSSNFRNGDKVNETPYFIANVHDKNGINTVGSGIGHSIMLTIDNDPFQVYEINEYFVSDPGNFTTGMIKYQISDLSEGKHTLTFRVCDLLNNSSSQTLNFEVVKGLSPEIIEIYNYPNPVKTSTSFKISHDRPETVLEAKVEIFDLTGQSIWTFTQPTIDRIDWDLTTINGTPIRPGIYLYRVSIKTTYSDFVSKSNKIIILGQ